VKAAVDAGWYQRAKALLAVLADSRDTVHSTLRACPDGARRG
jgi:hypothetical protein